MIWAWIGAAVVGLSLGLLGSGGAILTVPILVYLVGHDEKSSIVESLAIVGSVAVVGAIRAAMQRRVDLTSAAMLAIPGMLGTYAGAYGAQFIAGAVQLLMLAGLMLTAAVLMFRARPALPHSAAASSPLSAMPVPTPLWIMAVQGIGLGLVTGLVGVGGGFLIIPVLVLVRKLAMPTAVGTSLVIIAVNSMTGLGKSLSMLGEQAANGGAAVLVDWKIVGLFIVLGVAGSLIGNALAGLIDQHLLKRIFAIFLVVMAGYIVLRQAPRVFPDAFSPPAYAAPTVSGSSAKPGTASVVCASNEHQSRLVTLVAGRHARRKLQGAIHDRICQERPVHHRIARFGQPDISSDCGGFTGASTRVAAAW